jgi:nicotinate-nucleotide adenylyltransferase
MSRVGIFSGTFDPVHRGHIAFALAALKQCNLDKIVLLPERSPRGKVGVSDFKHRLHMMRLAARPHRKLSVLTLEDQTFTVGVTLPQLQERYSGAQLVMLFGSDVVQTFGFRWPGLETLLAQVEIAVSTRAGETEEALRSIFDSFDVKPITHFVHGPHAHVSATEVRKGDLQGIEPVVREYIQQNQLYGLQSA